MAGDTNTPRFLCGYDEIEDPGARGFMVETAAGMLDVIVVRNGNAVHGFLNRCPHQGTPLETFPDRFLSRDGNELICSTHGARFRLDDGLCVHGPCTGSRLKPIAVEMTAGRVCVADPERNLKA